eukprot:TRINITY_DN4323_c0_g1_i4.p1 TRINITY_DN4323_c0_g1~~TRINITY_DN4323_c0_g1_i4.p1  ORF type:complete len:327 (+),score=13.93 TRINITY_DN4323_c0_g1_i4:34-981(+)
MLATFHLAILCLTSTHKTHEKQTESWPSEEWKTELETNKARMSPTIGRKTEAGKQGSGRCKSNWEYVSCTYHNTTFEDRWVGWQTPEGKAPEEGWPFVVIYHGWGLMNSVYCWYAEDWYSYGLFYKAQTVEKFLNMGYGVVTPDSNEKTTYWETNQTPYVSPDLKLWNTSRDNTEVDWILSKCKSGFFGPCNPNMVHSIGFSSGAYMSGRMAVNYPHRYQSISILSGSFYYCYGETCSTGIANEVPAEIFSPPSHPRTFFTHGTNDSLVPYWSSALYHDYLLNHSVQTVRKSFPGMNHQWPPSSADDLYNWVTLE